MKLSNKIKPAVVGGGDDGFTLSHSSTEQSKRENTSPCGENEGERKLYHPSWGFHSLE